MEPKYPLLLTDAYIWAVPEAGWIMCTFGYLSSLSLFASNHVHTYTHTHTLTHSLTHSHTHTHTHTTHTHSHTHIHNTHTHTHTLTHIHTPHTLTHTHTHTHTLSHTHSHILTHTLTHTHTHTHTLTHTGLLWCSLFPSHVCIKSSHAFVISDARTVWLLRIPCFVNYTIQRTANMCFVSQTDSSITSLFRSHVSRKIFPLANIHIQGVPGGMCQTSGECSLH
jgi:hypothetical protein